MLRFRKKLPQSFAGSVFAHPTHIYIYFSSQGICYLGNLGWVHCLCYDSSLVCFYEWLDNFWLSSVFPHLLGGQLVNHFSVGFWQVPSNHSVFKSEFFYFYVPLKCHEVL